MTVRQNDWHVREVDRDIIDVHRVRVLEANPTAARQARAHAGVPGVEHCWQARLGDDCVQRVGHPVVGEERLQVRVELHPTGSLADEPASLHHRALAAVRVDADERDQHVAISGGDLEHLVVADGHLAGVRLVVDAEDDRRHPALAIVGGHILRVRPAELGVKVPRGGVEHRGRDRVRGVAARELRMSVDVYRDNLVEGDVHDAVSTASNSSAWPTAAQALVSVRTHRIGLIPARTRVRAVAKPKPRLAPAITATRGMWLIPSGTIGSWMQAWAYLVKRAPALTWEPEHGEGAHLFRNVPGVRQGLQRLIIGAARAGQRQSHHERGSLLADSGQHVPQLAGRIVRAHKPWAHRCAFETPKYGLPSLHQHHLRFRLSASAPALLAHL
jgi:hypothetical protein